jgi:hypothetical protein
MFGFYVSRVFHFTACKFDLCVDTPRSPVCSFFLIYVSKNDNVHTIYCFKHWAMDDTITASCINTASTGFSDIHVFFYKFTELKWTYY